MAQEEEVFASEEWYQSFVPEDGAPAEEKWIGTLRAVGGGGFGFTMRTVLYKLEIEHGEPGDHGERNIHSAGETNAVLDSYLNKRVEIRGKRYDIELGGKRLKEIWPAYIKALPLV